MRLALRLLVALTCGAGVWPAPMFEGTELVCTGRQASPDTIVVVGQKRHSSYDATHVNRLEDLFHNINRFYPAVRECDTLLFHEGEFTPAEFDPVGYTGNLRLCDLGQLRGVWGRPHVKGPIAKVSGFAPGYLKMIRFYAVTIWEALALLGYEWVMRFDDDSRLHTVVAYNLFADMRAGGYVYGYRMLSEECGSREFLSFIANYQREAGTFDPENQYCK